MPLVVSAALLYSSLSTAIRLKGGTREWRSQLDDKSQLERVYDLGGQKAYSTLMWGGWHIFKSV